MVATLNLAMQATTPPETIIPDDERWLHDAPAAADLARALAWATQSSTSDAQTDTFLTALAQSQ